MEDGGYWGTIAGQPTDDSELALMLARTVVRDGGMTQERVRRSYWGWLESGPFDVGITTEVGLTELPNVESQANGALMRVSPLGIFGWRTATSGAGPARPRGRGHHPSASGLPRRQRRASASR